jgi:hypothetical protein
MSIFHFDFYSTIWAYATLASLDGFLTLIHTLRTAAYSADLLEIGFATLATLNVLPHSIYILQTAVFVAEFFPDESLRRLQLCMAACYSFVV